MYVIDYGRLYSLIVLPNGLAVEQVSFLATSDLLIRFRVVHRRLLIHRVHYLIFAFWFSQ